MRPEKPKRVDTSPQQQGLAALGEAFAGLNLGPLPAGAAPGRERVEAAKPARKGRVILRKETARRGGKVVIVIHDFAPAIAHAELEALARRLRQAIGTGGTVTDRTIEIQGEHAPKIRALLESEGYQVAGV